LRNHANQCIVAQKHAEKQAKLLKKTVRECEDEAAEATDKVAMLTETVLDLKESLEAARHRYQDAESLLKVERSCLLEAVTKAEIRRRTKRF